MKKIFLILTLMVAPLTAMHAQRVVTDNFNRLEVHYQTPTLQTESIPFADSKADVLSLAGYQLGGELGSPALPMSIDMITIPFCDDVEVEVTNAVYDTLTLFINNTIYPLQPSRIKSDTIQHAPVIDADRYATNAFWGMPLASVEVLGVARDRRLANLTFSPVQVNPVTNEVIVCRSADITVHYINSDAEGTQEHFNRYHTPAFSAGTTLNQLVSLKEVLPAPIRMVIMASGSLRCEKLNLYANWKRSQGMLVNLVYTDDAQLSDNTAIANYLKSIYTNATVKDPAPTYLILVGDNEQIPAFESRVNVYSLDDHVTDLYFVTWTGNDNIPDCYQGRFSATDTNTVAAIIKKTLLYEQYAFDNDEYLAHAALIAGEDNAYHSDSYDNAWRYCDPSMDYIAKTYINYSNGFDTVSYYKNNVDFVPDGVTVTGYCSDNSTATALRRLYSEGLGWINYSAHGDWDRWHKPTFTNSNINSMSNKGKPSVMIGNCCLTNKFDNPSCFGETLLRKKENAGAVIYIGGTNSTIWAEDFYWSVGIRSNINNQLNPSYDSENLGIYDRLFHTHNENNEQYAVSAGSLVFYGNMAVNTSSSRYKHYYWEIYELMGDPSLLPWLGRASDLTVNVNRNDNTIDVTTAPNAYVAIVDSLHNNVIAAAFANERGIANLNIDNTSDISAYCLSITSQGHKPYHKSFNEITVGINQVSDNQPVNVYPNPATDHVTIDAPGLRLIELLDLTGRTLKATSSVTLDIQDILPGVYFLRLHTDTAVSVKKLVVNK